MNSFNGIGNLGDTPVLRNTASNSKSVCNFKIAIDRPYKSADGTSQVDWIPVVVWGGQAESCAKYLQKGSKVAIEGSVRPRRYEDENGVKHNTFEVAASRVSFLDRIRSNAEVATDSVVTSSPELPN